MIDPSDRALGNIVATFALALTDRITADTERAAGRGSQAPAALVALLEFLGGGTIEQLRQTLGLSHSAGVRLVDRLVADGLVVRHEAPGDARTVALELTAAGRSAARSILRARSVAVQRALDSLTQAERRDLQTSVGKLLAEITRSRLADRVAGRPMESGWMCRLCDFRACGRTAGKCPTTNAAAASKI